MNSYGWIFTKFAGKCSLLREVISFSVRCNGGCWHHTAAVIMIRPIRHMLVYGTLRKENVHCTFSVLSRYYTVRLSVL